MKTKDFPQLGSVSSRINYLNSKHQTINRKMITFFNSIQKNNQTQPVTNPNTTISKAMKKKMVNTTSRVSNYRPNSILVNRLNPIKKNKQIFQQIDAKTGKKVVEHRDNQRNTKKYNQKDKSRCQQQKEQNNHMLDSSEHGECQKDKQKIQILSLDKKDHSKSNSHRQQIIQNSSNHLLNNSPYIENDKFMYIKRIIRTQNGRFQSQDFKNIKINKVKQCNNCTQQKACFVSQKQNYQIQSTAMQQKCLDNNFIHRNNTEKKIKNKLRKLNLNLCSLNIDTSKINTMQGSRNQQKSQKKQSLVTKKSQKSKQSLKMIELKKTLLQEQQKTLEQFEKCVIYKQRLAEKYRHQTQIFSEKQKAGQQQMKHRINPNILITGFQQE